MSKLQTSKTLAGILADTKREIAEDKRREPLSELKRKLSSAPRVNSFRAALNRPGHGLIAEIKECSPSKGLMLQENVLLLSQRLVRRPAKNLHALVFTAARALFLRGR